MLIRRLFFEILIFISFITFPNIFAFNIDTHVPIFKNGPEGSYFGYQVTFHIYPNASTTILVGAPKASLNSIDGTKANSGSAYVCSYDSVDHCSQVDLGNGVRGLHMEDMWLGGAIDSQVMKDGKAVICGHRFKKNDWGEGQCFILRHDLTYDSYSSPCGGDREKEKGHEEFGFCQAGMSAEYTKDNDLVMGVPGSYTWRGGVAKKKIEDSLDFDEDIDEAEYMSKVGNVSATKPYSYLGFAVKTGHVLADQAEVTFIGGAPRSQEKGQVVFFTIDPAKRSGTKKDLLTRKFLTGEQFGSYFGFSLAVIDVNDDGYDDLVVGAPFYRDTWLGGAAYLYINEAGKGIDAHTTPQRITSQLLTKTECFKINCINAQFGHTLANIGDIDLDGFQDLAIGAPYEGKGVVYVYKGGDEGLTLTQRITQASFSAMPETFGTSIYGGGIDLDNNGYPDIVVGAYNAAKVVILRSRPIVVVRHIFQALPYIIDPSITSCPQDGDRRNCLEIRVCFKLAPPKVASQKSSQRISYKIEAEKFTGTQISRIKFAKNLNSEELRDSMRVTKEQNCQEHRVYINDNIRDFLNSIPFRLTYALTDLLAPDFTPNYPIPSLDGYPVMDDSLSNHTIMVDFKKNCGDDHVCKSNLQLQASLELPRNDKDAYRLRVGLDKEVRMDISVSNLGEDAHEATLYINLTNNIKLAGLDSEKGEIFCDVAQQPIPCNLGNPLVGGGKEEFRIRLNTELATATKENVFIGLFVNTTSNETDETDNKQDLVIEIKVETDLAIRGSSVPVDLYYSGEVRGASVVTEEEDIGPEVKHSYEIKNIGNATVPKSQVTISWPYELNNKHTHGKHLLYIMDPPLVEGDARAECTYDPTIVNPLNVKIDYSKRLQTKDQFNLQMLEAKLQSKDNDNNNDNYNNYNDGSSGSSGSSGARVKRSLYSSDKLKTIDCDEGSAKCHKIVCQLEKLRQGNSVVVKIRARLWNSTFIEEFKDYDRVNVFSKAEVFIDPAYNIQQTNKNNDILKIRTSVQPELKESRGVAWWVILVAILVGVLLLIALVLLLWKCGFFKRTRGGHMTSHKAEMLKKEYEE